MLFNTLNKKYFLICISFFLTLFTTLSINYYNYLDLVEEEIFTTKSTVLNIYKKEDYNILKFQSDNFVFFTKVPLDLEVNKLDSFNVTFISKNRTFLEYMKGFFTQTLFLEKIEHRDTLKYKLYNYINLSHKDEKISQLFNALFLAIPVDSSLREVFTNYGISHLIALSGLHLSVVFFISYYIFYFPYNFFHQRFFPYRNKKFDLIIISLFFIFLYLLLTNIVPSLLRAFVMFCIGIFLLRNNIKLISYKTLFFTFMICICLFPSFLFSIGFWFSIIAVFYIFLYIQYFKNLSKFTHIIFFNIWIFLVFNPIVHFFFPQTSYEQLFSPLLTILFTIFYPLEIFLHLLGISDFLDPYLLFIINKDINVFLVSTNIYFLFFYAIISLLSIMKKEFFLLLNLLMIAYNLYLY